MFRHDDRPQVISIRVPDPDALRPGHKEIAFVIYLDTVGDPLVFPSRLGAKDTTIAESSSGRNLVDANVALLAIVHVELLAIRREGQSIRLRQISGQQTNASVVIQPVNSWERSLLFFSRNQIEGWIREMERTIRPDNHVVQTIEALSVVPICEYFVFSVGSHLDDGSQDARTIDQPMAAIEGITIRVAQCDELFFLPCRLDRLEKSY